MRRFCLELVCSFVFLISGFLVYEAATLVPDNGARPVQRKGALNGISFSIPKGYVLIPQTQQPNAALLYYRKYKEGLVVAIPSAPFNEDQLVKDIAALGLGKFFPKDLPPFEWRRTNNHRRLSKYEVGGDQSMGFNKRTLVLLSSHHLRFAEREILVVELSKWENGNGQEVFARGLGAESMQGCNDKVELIYSITGEKIDETNAPCELIALPPSARR